MEEHRDKSKMTDNKYLQTKDYELLVKAFESSNTPVANMVFRGPVPSELKILFENFTKKWEITTFEARHKLLVELEKIVKRDPKRVSAYEGWDITIEQKDDYVLEKYPELLVKRKDETLVSLNYPTKINKNGFMYKDRFLIFPSIFTANFHFTNWIIKNWLGQFKLSLSFELDKLGIPETEKESILLSHWFGPKTKKNVKENFNNTIKVVFGATDTSWSTEIFDKTEFYFNRRKGEWHLEIEELLPLQNLFYTPNTQFRQQEMKYYTKYLHAITDRDINSCTHIDGAIRVYDTRDNFLKRHSIQFQSDPKEISKRYKLFRFDSDAGITSFQEIIGLFFLHNPYVHEFFEGESEFTRDMESKRTIIFKIDSEKRDILSDIYP